MKKISLFIIFTILSCNSDVNQLEAENIKLKKNNDSLKAIIDTLNTKYIFDHAALLSYPIDRNKNDKNLSRGIITFMAYNKSDTIVYGSKFDYKNRKLINPLILSPSGIFKVNRAKIDTIFYQKINKSKYGRNYDRFTTDPLNHFP